MIANNSRDLARDSALSKAIVFFNSQVCCWWLVRPPLRLSFSTLRWLILVSTLSRRELTNSLENTGLCQLHSPANISQQSVRIQATVTCATVPRVIEDATLQQYQMALRCSQTILAEVLHMCESLRSKTYSETKGKRLRTDVRTSQTRCYRNTS